MDTNNTRNIKIPEKKADGKYSTKELRAAIEEADYPSEAISNNTNDTKIFCCFCKHRCKLEATGDEELCAEFRNADPKLKNEQVILYPLWGYK